MTAYEMMNELVAISRSLSVCVATNYYNLKKKKKGLEHTHFRCK